MMEDDDGILFPDAACRGLAQELWFPPAFDEDPTGTDTEYFEVAKMVCSTCLHKSDCAQLGQHEKWGVWGGLTPAERRRDTERPSKRVMSSSARAVLAEHAPAGTHVHINPLQAKLKLVTHKRISA